jgi:hypothetical protein
MNEISSRQYLGRNTASMIRCPAGRRLWLKLYKLFVKKLDGNYTLFYHPYTCNSCAGDYQSDNHSKTPPYILKCFAFELFVPYMPAILRAYCASNS